MLRTMSALLLATVAATGWAESLAERIKATDMSNAEQVFELAEWCSANNLPTKARQYYNQVIKLDKDHEGARTFLGQVRVGDRWVSAKAAGVAAKPAADAGAGGAAPAARTAAGPGPTAEQITWDLTVPKDPEPQSTFINQYIDRMSSVGNDSRDMDVSVATILMDEHLAKALPRVCAALMRPDFRDLYGASTLVMELLRRGEAAKARQLLPFLVAASGRITEAEDLATFAYAAAMLKDKRVVPRLIQLLATGGDEVRDAAVDGLGGITLLPIEQITVERAQQWWDLNHNVSDQQTYQEQLNSQDPRVAVEAAKALYQYRDRAIVPVLIRLLRSDDRLVCNEAIHVIKQITGNTWSYDASGTPEEKGKRADELAKWWKEEQFRFRWIDELADESADAATAGNAADPAAEWVRQLGSVAGNEAATAEGNLINQGAKSVPALIAGLENPGRLVRRKCHELLVKVSKQDLPFDAAAGDAERAGQVAAWKKWAAESGQFGDEAATEGAEKAE